MDPRHPWRRAPSAIGAIAEQSDLISRVGAWVLKRSCADHQRWRASHRSANLDLDLAVNVSVHQIRAPHFVATVATVLAATDTEPDALILEVTESVLMHDADRAHLVLNELRETGIRIALDDFGTGFSSLSYLRQATSSRSTGASWPTSTGLPAEVPSSRR